MDFKVQMHCDLFSKTKLWNLLSFKIHVVTLILLRNLESYMQTKALFNNTSTKKKRTPTRLKKLVTGPEENFSLSNILV